MQKHIEDPIAGEHGGDRGALAIDHRTIDAIRARCPHLRVDDIVSVLIGLRAVQLDAERRVAKA